jgi:hypothetical protein
MSESHDHDWKKVYAANLEALKECYPGLYQNLLSVDSDRLTTTVHVRPEGGLPDIVLDDQGRKVLYYGSDDPMGYCREYLKALDLHYAPVLVFLGFGMGYQILAALNDFSQQLNIQHVLIVEKDPEFFRAAMMASDFSRIIRHPRIRLFVGEAPEDLFTGFRKHINRVPEVSHYFKSFKLVILPAARHFYGRYYEAAAKSLKSVVMLQIQHVGNDPYDSLLGVEQTLDNLQPALMDPGIAAFKDIFKGRPAILVGAGPSLNGCIDFLREASQRAVLVCVDAAFKPLMKKGIQPHVVTSIERSGGQGAFFSGLKGVDHTYFVFCPVTAKETYDAYAGPKIIAHRYLELDEWLGLGTGALTAGPLVGNFAFNIAEYFGCGPIIMVGQDLSFPERGATHVEGMVFGTQERYRSNMLTVKGNFGETLKTNRYFEESRKSLETQIHNFGGLCVNATEGGAKINGSVLLNLKSALDRYCTDSHDFSAQLRGVWEKEKHLEQDITGETERILSVLTTTVAELKISMDACQEGMEMIASVEENHQMLIDRKPNPGAIETVNTMAMEVSQIRERIISCPKLKFLQYIFSGFHNDFAMRRNDLFDHFHDQRFTTLKAFFMEKEWFAVMGQLILSTIYSMEKAQAHLEKEMI